MDIANNMYSEKIPNIFLDFFLDIFLMLLPFLLCTQKNQEYFLDIFVKKKKSKKFGIFFSKNGEKYPEFEKSGFFGRYFCLDRFGLKKK